MSFILIINIVGFCLGLLACIILLFANKTQRYANNFLVICLAGLTLSMFQAILTNSGYLNRYPHLFRVFSPVFYMIMPAAYLYLRAILFDETRLRRSDLLHFIPAVLHFFELLPWYLTDATTKREVIDRFLTSPDFVIQLKEGLLPAYTHNFIRSILSIGYVIAMHRLLWKTSFVKEGPFRIIWSVAFRWLQVFCYSLTFLIIFFFGTLVLPAHTIGRTNMINIIISSLLIVINFYLFSKPQILYGIPHIQHLSNKQFAETITIEEPARLLSEIDHEPSPDKQPSSTESTHSALDYLAAYQPVVEKHLSDAKPFLKQGYSLVQLSEETGIPRHHLSALLNKMYGNRFNDFINRYRIQYITQNMDDPEWPKLTLEGIARQAGFNSRTTFFNAIKKFTGLPPSEFLEKAKNKQIDLFEKLA
ncbi:MAG: AraC family transcriptional regulator [Chitinophagaceae bacterium]|nr:AraC family transcriptional regulator [Chitinophagaceae bacterium]